MSHKLLIISIFLFFFKSHSALACEFFKLNSEGWKIYCEDSDIELNKSIDEEWKIDFISWIGRNISLLKAKFEDEAGDEKLFPITIFMLPANHFENANAYFHKGRIFLKISNVNRKTLLHEMVHLINYRISNNKIPKWLDEGLASYIAKDERVKQLECDSSNCSEKNFYFDSYTKVKRLVDDIGFEELLEALKNNDEKILGEKN